MMELYHRSSIVVRLETAHMSLSLQYISPRALLVVKFSTSTCDFLGLSDLAREEKWVSGEDKGSIIETPEDQCW